MPAFYQDSEVPKVGVYENITYEEYDKWPAFRKSMIGPTLKSSSHLNHYFNNLKITRSLTIGTLFDVMLTDPEKLSDYVTKPETYTNPKGEDKPFNMNASACKEWVQDQVELGKIVVDSSVYSIAEEMVLSLRSIKESNDIVNNSIKQASLVWVDQETEVLCKARLDLMNNDFITDIKTTKDASIESFSRDIHNFGYHCQAGMYNSAIENLSGKKPDNFRIIATENSSPHCTALYCLDRESEEAGLIVARKAMLLYKSYLEQSSITGYSPLFTTISIPGYAKHKILMEGDNDGTGI